MDAELDKSESVGYEQINAPGAYPTMSGSSDVWAGFSGAYNNNAVQEPAVNTIVADSTGFGMFSDWDQTGTFAGS